MMKNNFRLGRLVSVQGGYTINISDIKQIYNGNVYYHIFLIMFAFTAIIDSVNGYLNTTTNLPITSGQIYRLIIMITMAIIILKFQRRANTSFSIFLISYLALFSFTLLFFHHSFTALKFDLIETSRIILMILTIEAFRRINTHN